MIFNFQVIKDLGVDKCNLNLESPTAKVADKTVDEVKIQNVQDNRGNQLGIPDAQKEESNSSNQAVSNLQQNQHLQPVSPNNEKVLKRKLSSK